MLQELLKKMNYKGQSPVVVLNAPEGFFGQLVQTIPDAVVLPETGPVQASAFMMAFATRQAEVDTFAVQMAEKLDGDGMIWLIYPKVSSKKYKCEFNRDNGWTKLGELGFEPVRMIAVDADWSALRFRKVDFIKKMTRSFAMTESGKQKAGK